MWKHQFEAELIFDSDQMDVITESYQRQVKDGFCGTLEDFIDTLAQVGICTTLLKLAKGI